VDGADHTPEEEARERDASGFFAAFPAAALEELLSVTAVRSYSEGDTVVREGDPGDSLYLIAEGHVTVLTSDPGGRDVPLARLGPGDFFGEVAVLTGRPRTATIVVSDPVTVIEIQRELLDSIFQRHPEVEIVLRRFYEKRAQATVETMLARLRGKGD
jgi:cAMP-dependent protein kinase regulator